jgi:hypothetical protein
MQCQNRLVKFAWFATAKLSQLKAHFLIWRCHANLSVNQTAVGLAACSIDTAVELSAPEEYPAKSMPLVAGIAKFDLDVDSVEIARFGRAELVVVRSVPDSEF